MWHTITALSVDTPTDPVNAFAQYGPLGLMVVGFLTGWIVPGPVAKQKDAEIVRLQHLFEDKVLPMSETYAATIAETNRVLERALRALEARDRGGSG